MTNKITLGLAGLVILILGVFLPLGNSGKTVVERVSDNTVGARNTPDLAIGEFQLYSQGRPNLTQATNTVICSLQSPAGTSTLIAGGISILTATSAPTSVSISKSTTNASIGTVIATTSVASGAQVVLDTSSTTVSSATIRTFSPNTFINFAQQGGGNLNQTGECSALWHVI